MDDRRRHTPDRFMLWVDGVGGYWVCLADEVILGQPIREGAPDVPIMADLSSRHARISRDEEGYLIEPIREVRLGGRALRGPTPLVDRARIQLGVAVRLVFRRPHVLSHTARLDFDSPHRTQPSADAVLLLSDSCILGPKPTSHVVCRDWPREIVLCRQKDGLACWSAGPLEIDGIAYRDRGPATCHSRITGEGFSFSLEPLV